jgi:hypothetical protein
MDQIESKMKDLRLPVCCCVVRFVLMVSVSIGLSLGMSGALAQESAPKETLRPEVAKPLQAVQELVNAGKFQDALAKIREADALPDKTSYEKFIIDQMRGAVAARAGDKALSIKSYEAVIEAGRLPTAETLPMMEAIAGTYFQDKDYKRAAAWAKRFIAEGGVSQRVRLLMMQSLYLSGDYENAAREISADIQTTEKAGKIPAEDLLLLLASCALKQNDQAAYVGVVEKLVTYHAKENYWAELIYRVESKPTFDNRLALNLYRLKFELGQINKGADYLAMAQLAMQAGFPSEARKVLDQGFAKSALGSGPDVAAQNKLRELVNREAAQDQKRMAESAAEVVAEKDGTGSIGVGFNHVINGQGEKGVNLMELGVKKGGLKRPEEARLRLGMAYALTGQKQKAVDTLKTVQGADGTTDLARLWTLFALQPAR